jgi:cell division protease FtsH
VRVVEKILGRGAIVIVVLLSLVALFNLFNSPPGGPRGNRLLFSDFIADVERGQIVDVMLMGRSITGHFGDGRALSSFAPDMPDLVSRLLGWGVSVDAGPAEDVVSGFAILVSWFPLAIWTLGLWYFVGRPLIRAVDTLRQVGQGVDQIANRSSKSEATAPSDR